MLFLTQRYLLIIILSLPLSERLACCRIFIQRRRIRIQGQIIGLVLPVDAQLEGTCIRSGQLGEQFRAQFQIVTLQDLHALNPAGGIRQFNLCALAA